MHLHILINTADKKKAKMAVTQNSALVKSNINTKIEGHLKCFRQRPREQIHRAGNAIRVPEPAVLLAFTPIAWRSAK
jgi:hypothetical protein